MCVDFRVESQISIKFCFEEFIRYILNKQAKTQKLPKKPPDIVDFLSHIKSDWAET